MFLRPNKVIDNVACCGSLLFKVSLYEKKFRITKLLDI
jgi:hypothetical protein